MEKYKHILLAVDFAGEYKLVARRAVEMTVMYQAYLSILHVVDNLPIADSVYGPVSPFEGDLTEELVAASKNRMAKIAEEFSIPENRQWIEIGSPKLEIVRVAEETDADLIVVGSHGRHGFGLLLGSTANGVLHHATCDVLAVRLQKPDLTKD